MEENTNTAILTREYGVLSRMIILMSHYTTKEHTGVVWTALTNPIVKGLHGETPLTPDQFARQLALINVLILARKGSRVLGTWTFFFFFFFLFCLVGFPIQ